MNKIKKFNETKTETETVIKHYFVRQKIQVSDIIRKQDDGKEIVINGIGVIKAVRDFGYDIAYDVEFDITLEHNSPFGQKWITKKNIFLIFHNEDKNNILKIM